MTDDNDELCGNTSVAVIVSFIKQGSWHNSEVWIGPVRLAGEKSKAWAERYSEAAKAQFNIPEASPLVIAEVSWFPIL